MQADCNINMKSQTSSPNLAIKSREQPSNSVTAKECRTYCKRIILYILNQKGCETSKVVMTALRHSK